MDMDSIPIAIEDKEIVLTNPHKVLWPEVGVTKLDYIQYLIHISPYLLPYTKNRLLMMWRFPDGIEASRIVQKSVPQHAPAWIPRAFYKDKFYILLNDLATLVWVANYAAIELHVPFTRHDQPDTPTDIAFDLDPSVPDAFETVLDVALQLHDVLNSLGLANYAKTSGATGLQIFVPIQPQYTFEQTRKITKFIAQYLLQKMPKLVTLERSVKNRGDKLYIDYLQLWKMRTLSAVYSVRATAKASVSTPVTWSEIARGFLPSDFTVFNVVDRVAKHGDLFAPIAAKDSRESLDAILQFVAQHKM